MGKSSCLLKSIGSGCMEYSCVSCTYANVQAVSEQRIQRQIGKAIETVSYDVIGNENQSMTLSYQKVGHRMTIRQNESCAWKPGRF